MPDAFAYCAGLVRTADRDRYLATLFAPAECRDGLYALYAFNSEVARVREVARQPLPGEIRLQWWSEVLQGERAAEAGANPVAAALLATVKHYQLAVSTLLALVEARRFDVYNEPMAGIGDLEAYARKTASTLFSLAGQILAGGELSAAADPAGMAYAIAVLLGAFPLHAARGQLYVPIDVLERHQVRVADVFSRRSSAGLAAALGELRTLARRHLAAAREPLRQVPPEGLAALLPLALVGPLLARLDRTAAFVTTDISPWRRQWLIWRAARNPARIA
ncbi:MAG: squalene/phytoene synthase family protein [Xanthobacteraceae bacterium]